MSEYDLLRGRRFKNICCPLCLKKFELKWDGDYKEELLTLRIGALPDGKLYKVFIVCPHCNYQEDI
jgi:hypothetical protein